MYVQSLSHNRSLFMEKKLPFREYVFDERKMSDIIFKYVPI